MNFIEKLKHLGGVKPCPCTERRFDEEGKYTKMDDRIAMYVGPVLKEGENPISTMQPCHLCHGTGTVIDLAPLLAKPTVLHGAVDTLLLDWWDKHPYRYMQDFTNFKKMYKNLYIVGPQRAHSLVYECARQLGGTAVVAIEQHSHHYTQAGGAEVSIQPYMHQCKVTLGLSLPIPPDATCLFVTDLFDSSSVTELEGVVQALPHATNVLPYMLCLVNASYADGVITPKKIGIANIIALHKE